MTNYLRMSFRTIYETTTSSRSSWKEGKKKWHITQSISNKRPSIIT